MEQTNYDQNPQEEEMEKTEPAQAQTVETPASEAAEEKPAEKQWAPAAEEVEPASVSKVISVINELKDIVDKAPHTFIKAGVIKIDQNELNDLIDACWAHQDAISGTFNQYLPPEKKAMPPEDTSCRSCCRTWDNKQKALHFGRFPSKSIEKEKQSLVRGRTQRGFWKELIVAERRQLVWRRIADDVGVVKDVRNRVNRCVNCETANINKTVTASMKQIEDIQFISSTVGIDALDENLQQIARLRLENTEVPLSELGKMLDPPIGKSGVNHRMRKISEIAADLREQRGE